MGTAPSRSVGNAAVGQSADARRGVRTAREKVHKRWRISRISGHGATSGKEVDTDMPFARITSISGCGTPRLSIDPSPTGDVRRHAATRFGGAEAARSRSVSRTRERSPRSRRRRTLCARRGLRSMIPAHQLGVGEDMTAHRAIRVCSCRSRSQLELLVERIQLEIVAMCRPGRWARTAVACSSEIVTSLPRTGRERAFRGNTCRQLALGWR